MKMTKRRPRVNRVKACRLERAWSQEELARRAAVSRAAISAIEIGRLVPSVQTALALARVFDTTVEDLFGAGTAQADKDEWAWTPAVDPCRFWYAAVGTQIRRYPVEATVAGLLPHDAVADGDAVRPRQAGNPPQTLVMASCDPAAGLLAAEYQRVSGVRLLPLYRSSQAALQLLQQGLVHVAGIHLATIEHDAGNASAARAVLGDGFALLHAATWDAGLAVAPERARASMSAILRADLRWVGREPGAGARQCQDELLGKQVRVRRQARDHQGVATAVRNGWADVGVCLRLVSEQAGLGFIPIRQDAYALCFPGSLQADVRLEKLIDVLRSTALHRLYEALPGYALARTIDARAI
jgi:molybdate-binding protein/DNA-binding XRE family transcriptional regulator